MSDEKVQSVPHRAHRIGLLVPVSSVPGAPSRIPACCILIDDSLLEAKQNAFAEHLSKGRHLDYNTIVEMAMRGDGEIEVSALLANRFPWNRKCPIHHTRTIDSNVVTEWSECGLNNHRLGSIKHEHRSCRWRQPAGPRNGRTRDRSRPWDEEGPAGEIAMNNFCVDTIPGNPHLRAHHGILRASGLPLTADARQAARLLVRDAQSKADALIENAHGMADDILTNARAEAEQILADAREQAQHETAAEQQRVIEQSAELLQSIQQTHDAVLERVEDMVVNLVQTLYDRVVMDTTPKERIDAALRRVIQEAPPKLIDTLLRVHPDDVPLLPEVDWPVKADATIAAGACRLEASNGQWCANFDTAVQAVKAAFAQGIEDAQNGTPAADEAGGDDATS